MSRGARVGHALLAIILIGAAGAHGEEAGEAAAPAAEAGAAADGPTGEASPVEQPADAEAQVAALLEELYGEEIARAEGTRETSDDVALAERLAGAAAAAADQPAMVVRLCEKAIELGSRDPAGFAAAREAGDRLEQQGPAHAARAREMLLPVHRQAFAQARLPEVRGREGKTLIEALLALAETKGSSAQVEPALALVREAGTVGQAIRSDRSPAIAEAQKRLQGLARDAGRVARLKGALARDPSDQGARKELVETLLVVFDNAAEASKHVAGLEDEALARYVPAAAKGVEAAPELACAELGDWYRDLAETAPGPAKTAMLNRACDYYVRFLHLRPAEDLSRTKVRLALERAEKALEALRGSPMVGLDLKHRVGPMGSVDLKTAVHLVAFPPNGPLAVAAVEKGLLVCHLETGRIIGTIEVPMPVWKLAISPRGDEVAAGLEAEEGWSLVQSWDLRTGRLLSKQKPKQGHLLGVGFEGSKAVAVRNLRDGHHRGMMHTWEIVRDRERPTWDHDWAYIRAVAWSSDMERVAVSDHGGGHQATLYDLTDGAKVIDRAGLGRSVDGPVGVWMTPDGKTAAVATREFAGTLDPATGKVAATCAMPPEASGGEEKPILTASLSADGRRLATALWNGKVVVFDGRTGSAVATFEVSGGWAAAGERVSLSLSPDGKFLLTGAGKTLRLWGVP